MSSKKKNQTPLNKVIIKVFVTWIYFFKMPFKFSLKNVKFHWRNLKCSLEIHLKIWTPIERYQIFGMYFENFFNFKTITFWQFFSYLIFQTTYSRINFYGNQNIPPTNKLKNQIHSHRSIKVKKTDIIRNLKISFIVKRFINLLKRFVVY